MNPETVSPALLRDMPLFSGFNATDLSQITELGVFQLLGLALVDDNAVGLQDCVGAAPDDVPGVPQQAGPVGANHHDSFESAAGQRHLAKSDDVRFRPFHARDRAHAVYPTSWNIAGEVDVMHLLVPDPNIGLTLIHQQSGLAD